MGTHYNFNSLAPIICIFTLSTSSVSAFNGDNFANSNKSHNYSFYKDTSLSETNYFKTLPQDFSQFSIEEKSKIFIEFSKKFINNTKDIENEFLAVVNNNFWELL